ncbi:LmeA family phospholipid-binding protein [Nocardia transvalensis]|uniref:LmeA family phospholipid-binding protein n=1 Tax=Nocardia transvalensis TaxID=37333 RepID=UPI001894A9A1|nr:LmeA family phospholipid-binding protein [Nocardia transvalensis]MBF6332597.1 DUF2993 domain-containing protein [Nocardia transvalensis]
MRKVIVGLLLVVGLAVVADFTAAAYSEYRVSRALRAGGELSADPEVTIHGFPFVAQAWRGDYRNVEIRARVNRPDIPGEILAEATLSGVHLPSRNLIDAKMQTVPVNQVKGRMIIDSIELGRLMNIPNLSLVGPPADKSDGTGGSGGTGMTTQGNTYLLSGTIMVSPETRSTARVSVKVNLLLDGDQVRIVATDIYRGEGDATTTAAAYEQDLDKTAILARFSRTIDTKDLPFGVHPTKVQAIGGDIIVEGEGEDMTIEMDRFARP